MIASLPSLPHSARDVMSCTGSPALYRRVCGAAPACWRVGGVGRLRMGEASPRVRRWPMRYKAALGAVVLVAVVTTVTMTVLLMQNRKQQRRRQRNLFHVLTPEGKVEELLADVKAGGDEAVEELVRVKVTLDEEVATLRRLVPTPCPPPATPEPTQPAAPTEMDDLWRLFRREDEMAHEEPQGLAYDPLTVDLAPYKPLFDPEEWHPDRKSWLVQAAGKAFRVGVGGDMALCDKAARKYAGALPETPWLRYVGVGRPYPHNDPAQCVVSEDKDQLHENEKPIKNLARAPWVDEGLFPPLPNPDVRAILLDNVPGLKERLQLSDALNKRFIKAAGRALLLGRAFPEHPATIPVFISPAFLDAVEMMEMLTSLDAPVRQFVFVQNLDNEATTKIFEMLALLPFGVRVLQHTVVQSGFAAAINQGITEGLRLVTDPSPAWFFAANADVVYNAHHLRQLAYYANKYGRHDYGLFYASEQEHYAFGIGRAAVDAVGLLDESIYPAYSEDVDYRWRVRLCGLGQIFTPARILHKGSTSLHKARDKDSRMNHALGAKVYRRIVRKNNNNMGYMRQKWGFFAQEHIYFHAPPTGVTRPWNVSGASLSTWSVDPAHRACIINLGTHAVHGVYDCPYNTSLLTGGLAEAAVRSITPTVECPGEEWWRMLVKGCGELNKEVIMREWNAGRALAAAQGGRDGSGSDSGF
eukprot:TRINITY_DN3280_c1_g6_i1.p2 TRINITY_DN3280_c1_g6~~TRINITY_DN3280_c1_g6_i1.p2  ORF type:complete len:698 (+),score=206.91 TRINITY_DN3280_c1_g6_i1:1165-3258(+)